jgi:predicted aconitase with swiveling domain
MTLLAKQAGYLDALEDFGGNVTVDTCILTTPMLLPEIKLLMTNSAKYAYYAPGLLGTQVTFGSLADCVQSAVAGRVMRDESLWGAGDEGKVDSTYRDVKHAGQERNGEPSLRAAIFRPSSAVFRPLHGDAVVRGQAQGIALVADEPLSFWGGYDFRTGEIIDRRHPLSGQRASGRILALPFARGSSTTTAVLLEAVRAGTAPLAILTTGVDAFFALTSIVADALYAKPIPVMALAPNDFARLRTGDRLKIDADGVITRSEN